MPINISSLNQIGNRIKATISRYLPKLDPSIPGSFLNTIVQSLGNRSYDFELLVNEQLQKQLFPQTADDDFLENRWANWEGIERFRSTISTGFAFFNGEAGTIVKVGSILANRNGDQFEVLTEKTIELIEANITSITRIGSIATVTTTENHNLGSNVIVTISGADQIEYNGAFEITVLDTDVFTFVVLGSPATPGTGTIKFSYTGVVTDLVSVEAGKDKNIENGSELNPTITISGLTNAYVSYPGFSGGADIEGIERLRARTLQSRSNPVANFNVAAIEKQMLKVPGVTRTKIKKITPRIGAVTCLFVKDDEDDIIPTSTDVQVVKSSILLIAQATSDENDIVVKAPTPVETDYDFSSIDPDTPTMREAINNSIKAFYEDEVYFETSILKESYTVAISQTIDLTNGEKLASFALNSPTTDITVGVDQIGVKGQITF